MKKVILLVALLAITTTTFAQDYKWAVGARIGGATSGLAVKHKIAATTAIEGILSIPYDKGFVVTGLYEKVVPVIADGFNFYYGGGAHIGSWGDHDKFRLGVDGVVGLEYKVPEIPFAFSVSYKPSLDIISDTQFHFEEFGLGIKFVF